MKTQTAVIVIRIFLGRPFGKVNQYNEQGQKHGHWIKRHANGCVAEGSMVDGRGRGHWVLRYARGNVEEFCYKNGNLPGPAGRYPDGTVGKRSCRNGEVVDE